MKKHIDPSINTLRYTMAIMTGGALQVSSVLQKNDDSSLDGDFILTAGKKIVILTKDRTPVIVKRWKLLNLKKYLIEKYPLGPMSYQPITKVYQDNDGWIWERINDKIGGRDHFTVIIENDILYSIYLR